MKNSLILLFIFSIFLGCNSQTKVKAEKEDVTNKTVQAKNIINVLDVITYKKAISNDVQLVDVRTPKEYNQGFIKNAKNIDYFSSDFKTQFQELDKEKPLYIYCRSGGRSAKASKILKTLGFKEIYDLKGGYLAWSKQ
jgi:rhodanese-related sulfurtransferase